MFKLYRLKNYNFRLIIWLLMISGIGVLLVGSAKASLQSRQLIGVILGLVVMVAVSLMDYSWLLNFYWIIYVFNIVMLLIVRFFGDSAGGATRWLDLGFIRFQPDGAFKDPTDHVFCPVFNGSRRHAEYLEDDTGFRGSPCGTIGTDQDPAGPEKYDYRNGCILSVDVCGRTQL